MNAFSKAVEEGGESVSDMESKELPPIKEQYIAAARYAEQVFPGDDHRQTRKEIAGFANIDHIEDAVGEEFGGMPGTFIFAIAAIRRAAELKLECDAPDEISFGRSIIGQVQENFANTDYPWPQKERKFEAHFLQELDAHCRNVVFKYSLPDTELGEDQVEEVLDVDAPGYAPEVTNG